MYGYDPNPNPTHRVEGETHIFQHRRPVQQVTTKVTNNGDGTYRVSILREGFFRSSSALDIPCEHDLIEAVKSWNNGALIQEAMPFISADLREWFICG